ncbi:bacteriochlorophyll 4-vinyl reductase [Clostridium cibarium]|uniref:Bacteriochlorophyll 4-vinyl reductase n=1 Tax=Clostridium cibarium TaxID=2762247 RepID=A0ABR8PUR8_9CLOT|nr:bacteriochlorophyll 4-vinyl reductase [Clostridium cibarium]MBD7911874.1 bacteriochlorophyll 4-vinyl reductase [Clostridium cibarium]
MNNLEKKTKRFETVLTLALKIPGIRVNRKDFLEKELNGYISQERINKAIKLNTIEASINLKVLNKIADNVINKRTNQTAGASFIAGLPGGFGITAAIPADVLQYFGVALKIAQELAYLYGFEDLWKDNNIDDEKVKNELILFLGAMFGVGGATTAVRLISNSMAKQVFRKLQEKALAKTIYYSIIKKISIAIGITMTKDTFAKGVSKAIPILGGIISGGVTYMSMKPMGKRLKDVLSSSFGEKYTIENLERDIIELEKETGEVIEKKYKDEIKELAIEEEGVGKDGNIHSARNFDLADELFKLKNVFDEGIVTEEEFEEIKRNIIHRSMKEN